jgi:hypothetical protein
VPSGGREKPWRLIKSLQSIPQENLDLEQRQAVDALARVFLEREVDRLRAWLARAPAVPVWQRASGMYGTSIEVTADELAELLSQLREVADRYQDRRANRGGTTSETRSVRIFIAASVDPLPAVEG